MVMVQEWNFTWPLLSPGAIISETEDPSVF